MEKKEKEYPQKDNKKQFLKYGTVIICLALIAGIIVTSKCVLDKKINGDPTPKTLDEVAAILDLNYNASIKRYDSQNALLEEYQVVVFESYASYNKLNISGNNELFGGYVKSNNEYFAVNSSYIANKWEIELDSNPSFSIDEFNSKFSLKNIKNLNVDQDRKINSSTFGLLDNIIWEVEVLNKQINEISIEHTDSSISLTISNNDLSKDTIIYTVRSSFFDKFDHLIN